MTEHEVYVGIDDGADDHSVAVAMKYLPDGSIEIIGHKRFYRSCKSDAQQPYDIDGDAVEVAPKERRIEGGK